MLNSLDRTVCGSVLQEGKVPKMSIGRKCKGIVSPDLCRLTSLWQGFGKQRADCSRCALKIVWRSVMEAAILLISSFLVVAPTMHGT